MFHLIVSIENRLTSIINLPKYKLALILLLCSIPILIFTNPTFLYRLRECIIALINGKEYVYYEVIARQSENILRKINNIPYSHESKMQFRLFLPMLAKLSPISNKTLFVNIIQLPLGILFIGLFYDIVEKIIQNKQNTFWFMVGTMGLYIGTASYVDYFGFGDFFAYFFLLLSIYYKKPPIIFLALLLSYFCDERAIFGSLFVVAYYIIVENEALFFSKKILAIFISWIVYLILRFYLQSKMQVESTYFSGFVAELVTTFHQTSKMWAFRLWSAFEGFNLLIILAFVFLAKEKKYFYLFVLGSSLIVSVLFAMTAYDLTRGISYFFIILPISLYILKKYLTDSELKFLFFILAIICLIHPTTSKLTLYSKFALM